MVEEDLGEATIVYEGPDGTVEETVENEHVAYFQDHWIVKTGENEEGHDTVRRIPAQRVYHVERDVEEFEREARTVFDEFQAVADEFGRGVGSLREEFESAIDEVGTVIAGEGGEPADVDQSEVHRIDIETGNSDEGAEDAGGDTGEAGGVGDLDESGAGDERGEQGDHDEHGEPDEYGESDVTEKFDERADQGGDEDGDGAGTTGDADDGEDDDR